MVKAINTGTYLWHENELACITAMGNARAARLYLGAGRPPPKPKATDPDYIADKYDRKRWFDASITLADLQAIGGGEGEGGPSGRPAARAQQKTGARRTAMDSWEQPNPAGAVGGATGAAVATAARRGVIDGRRAKPRRGEKKKGARRTGPGRWEKPVRLTDTTDTRHEANGAPNAGVDVDVVPEVDLLSFGSAPAEDVAPPPPVPSLTKQLSDEGRALFERASESVRLTAASALAAQAGQTEMGRAEKARAEKTAAIMSSYGSMGQRPLGQSMGQINAMKMPHGGRGMAGTNHSFQTGGYAQQQQQQYKIQTPQQQQYQPQYQPQQQPQWQQPLRQAVPTGMGGGGGAVRPQMGGNSDDFFGEFGL